MSLCAVPCFVQAVGLDLNQAVMRSIQQHPSLMAHNFRLESADAAIAQSRIGARKTVDLEVENVLGSGDRSEFDTAETTLSVSWVLEGDLLDAREQQARANKSLVELQKDIRRLDIASETAARFITALMFQEKQKVAEQWQQDAAAMYQHIAQQVEAGSSSIADKYRARVERSSSKLELEDIHHEIDTAYVQLSAMWGESTPAFSSLTGEAGRIDPLPTFAALKAGLDNNPNLDVFLTRQRIAQSEARLAKTEAKSRWQFNAGVRHFAATDDMGLVAGVSVPLGSENRSRGRIAALNASASAYRSEAAALRVQLESQLFAFYQAYQHASHVIDVLGGEVIPDMEKALAATRKAYDLGRSDFQAWSQVQKELLENRMKLLEAYHLAHINRIEIERLTGASVASASVPARDQ